MRSFTMILVLMVYASGLASSAIAQGAVPFSLQGLNFKANFDVPDSPAFDLLHVDPSAILKPQTARDLSVQLSKVQGADGGFSIPRAMALEFSPLLLVNGDALITSANYERYKYLYATRLSVAALRDSLSGQVTRLAFGVRTTLYDQKCLKTDEAYAVELGVTELTDSILVIQSAASQRAIKNRPASVPIEKLDEYERTAASGPSFYTATEKEQLASLAKEISRRMAARYWNATVVEVAFGFRGTAADSTGRALQIDSVSGWGTYGKGYGSWGQLLLGLRSSFERDSLTSKYRQGMSISGRFYAGSARGRGFAEAQETFVSGRDAALLFDGGLEVSLSDWVWLNFSTGAESSDGTLHSVSAFKLKLGLPGI